MGAVVRSLGWGWMVGDRMVPEGHGRRWKCYERAMRVDNMVHELMPWLLCICKYFWALGRREKGENRKDSLTASRAAGRTNDLSWRCHRERPLPLPPVLPTGQDTWPLQRQGKLFQKGKKNGWYCSYGGSLKLISYSTLYRGLKEAITGKRYQITYEI